MKIYGVTEESGKIGGVGVTTDSFAYDLAKALDEHRGLFQVELEPWYYDPQTAAVSKVVPMHPGAAKYYREQGYAK